jgi:DNA-binding NarL/FixJ family response regulator
MLEITFRERAALELLAKEKGLNEIAGNLGVSEREAEEQLSMLFAKMGAATRTEAVSVAMRRGLVVPLAADVVAG